MRVTCGRWWRSGTPPWGSWSLWRAGGQRLTGGFGRQSGKRWGLGSLRDGCRCGVQPYELARCRFVWLGGQVEIASKTPLAFLLRLAPAPQAFNARRQADLDALQAEADGVVAQLQEQQHGVAARERDAAARDKQMGLRLEPCVGQRQGRRLFMRGD